MHVHDLFHTRKHQGATSAVRKERRLPDCVFHPPPPEKDQRTKFS